MLAAAEAARLRALDELGAGAAARRDGARARPRAGGAARPRLSARPPRDRHPRRRVLGRRPRPRRADRPRARHARARRRGRADRTTGRSSGATHADGPPLLAGDPHLPPSMPGIFYQVDLELDGRFARGASLPGVPGVSMGQNNDVASTFTNAMADVMDLFVERIDGDRYEFEGEWRPLEHRRGGDRGQGPPAARAARGQRAPTTARSSTRRSAPTRPSRWRCAGRRSTCRRSARRTSACSTPTSGPELVEVLSAHTRPGLEPGLGRPPRQHRLQDRRPDPDPPRRLPRPAEARLDRRVRVGGLVPYEEMPEARDPECGYLITANNRIAGEDYPHHITSDYLDGYRARRIEQLILGRARARRRRASRRCRPTTLDPRASRPSTGWRGCGRATSGRSPRSSG